MVITPIPFAVRYGPYRLSGLAADQVTWYVIGEDENHNHFLCSLVERKGASAKEATHNIRGYVTSPPILVKDQLVFVQHPQAEIISVKYPDAVQRMPLPDRQKPLVCLHSNADTGVILFKDNNRNLGRRRFWFDSMQLVMGDGDSLTRTNDIERVVPYSERLALFLGSGRTTARWHCFDARLDGVFPLDPSATSDVPVRCDAHGQDIIALQSAGRLNIFRIKQGYWARVSQLPLADVTVLSASETMPIRYLVGMRHDAKAVLVQTTEMAPFASVDLPAVPRRLRLLSEQTWLVLATERDRVETYLLQVDFAANQTDIIAREQGYSVDALVREDSDVAFAVNKKLIRLRHLKPQAPLRQSGNDIVADTTITEHTARSVPAVASLDVSRKQLHLPLGLEVEVSALSLEVERDGLYPITLAIRSTDDRKFELVTIVPKVDIGRAGYVLQGGVSSGANWRTMQQQHKANLQIRFPYHGIIIVQLEITVIDQYRRTKKTQLSEPVIFNVLSERNVQKYSFRSSGDMVVVLRTNLSEPTVIRDYLTK